MEIKVNFKNRDLIYSYGNKEGKELDSLIEHIGKNKSKIERIEFIGETHSYTFIRQIYLLINILASISDFEIYLNGKKVKQFEQIFPVYR